jgi:hypothetical protein
MKAIVPSNGNTVVYVDSSESGKHKWWRIISLDPAFTDNRWGITTIAFYNETMNKATGKMMASSACSKNGCYNNAVDNNKYVTSAAYNDGVFGGSWSSYYYNRMGKNGIDEWVGLESDTVMQLTRIEIKQGAASQPQHGCENFRVQYSDNGQTWITAIDSIKPNLQNMGVTVTYSFRFSNTTTTTTTTTAPPTVNYCKAYKYYRVYLTKNGGASYAVDGSTCKDAGAARMRPTITFMNNAKGNLTRNCGLSGNVNGKGVSNDCNFNANVCGRCSASACHSNYGCADCGFQGCTSVQWTTYQTGNHIPSWLKFTFDEPTEVSKYTIDASGNPVTAFVDWRFEASNDNANWITLDSQTGQNTVCKNEIQPKVYQLGCTDSTDFKCRHGYYGNTTGCIPWKKCNVGFKRVNGTATSDAICLPCEDGTFQPNNNFVGNNCTNWKICNSNEYGSIVIVVMEGTNSNDRVCKTITIPTTTTTTTSAATTTAISAGITTTATSSVGATTTVSASTTINSASTTTVSASTTINSASTTTNAAETMTTTTTKMIANATTNGTITMTTTKSMSTNTTSTNALPVPTTTSAPILVEDTQTTTNKPTSRGRNPSNNIDGDEEEDELSIATHHASCSLSVMLLISIITTLF